MTVVPAIAIVFVIDLVPEVTVTVTVRLERSLPGFSTAEAVPLESVVLELTVSDPESAANTTATPAIVRLEVSLAVTVIVEESLEPVPNETLVASISSVDKTGVPGRGPVPVPPAPLPPQAAMNIGSASVAKEFRKKFFICLLVELVEFCSINGRQSVFR